MRDTPFSITDEELRRIAREIASPVEAVRTALEVIPLDLRSRWIQLLQTDFIAATNMARRYGWTIRHALREIRK
jgi:hypothetical protein